MSSFNDFAINSDALLIGIMKSSFSSMDVKPIRIFIRICCIQRISPASSRNYLEIQSQSRLMFACADWRTFQQHTSLFDEIILKSFASICACYKQFITAKCISKMPGHISKFYTSLLSKFKRFSVISSKVRINRKQILWYIRRIVEGMISIQIFLERIISIKIKSCSLLF